MGVVAAAVVGGFADGDADAFVGVDAGEIAGGVGFGFVGADGVAGVDGVIVVFAAGGAVVGGVRRVTMMYTGARARTGGAR